MNLISQDYSFTTLSHSQIIAVMENIRLTKGLLKEELSKLAGYGRSRYTNLSNSASRFNANSYTRFCAVLKGTEVEPRVKSRRGKPFNITLEEAIAICKANGLRVAKSEVTTNWIEL